MFCSCDTQATTLVWSYSSIQCPVSPVYSPSNDLHWMEVNTLEEHNKTKNAKNADQTQAAFARSVSTEDIVNAWSALTENDTFTLKWLLLYPENPYTEITWAKVKVFSRTKSRPRKIQMFRPAHLNHTFLYLRTSEESWVAFFFKFIWLQSVLAPLKCFTTNMLLQSVTWPVGKRWNWQKVI